MVEASLGFAENMVLRLAPAFDGLPEEAIGLDFEKSGVVSRWGCN